MHFSIQAIVYITLYEAIICHEAANLAFSLKKKICVLWIDACFNDTNIETHVFFMPSYSEIVSHVCRCKNKILSNVGQVELPIYIYSC